jgi:hypothetical protein
MRVHPVSAITSNEVVLPLLAWLKKRDTELVDSILCGVRRLSVPVHNCRLVYLVDKCELESFTGLQDEASRTIRLVQPIRRSITAANLDTMTVDYEATIRSDSCLYSCRACMAERRLAPCQQARCCSRRQEKIAAS